MTARDGVQVRGNTLINRTTGLSHQTTTKQPFATIKQTRLNLSNRSCSSLANTTETSSSDLDAKSHETRRSRQTAQTRQPLSRTSLGTPKCIPIGHGTVTGKNLSDSEAGTDLMSFARSPVWKADLIDMDEPVIRVEGGPSNSWTMSSENSDSKRYSTICDSFLEDIAPVKVNSNGKVSTVRERRVSLGVSKNSGDIEKEQKETVAETELSLLDVLNFIADTLVDVKLWIHEVPVACRKRIGQCDAFLSYLSAKLYKDRDILVGSELFSFVLWFILKEYSAPEEYTLNLLENAFHECREKSWAADWSRLPIPQVIQDLPPSINCRNQSCLTRSIQPTPRSSVSDCTRLTKNQLKTPLKITPQNTSTVGKKGPVRKVTDNLFHQPSGPAVIHSLSIDSLSDALANTQLRKIDSPEIGGKYQNETVRPEKTVTILSAEEMSARLAEIAPPVRQLRGKNGRKTETAKRSADEALEQEDDFAPLTTATDILYKTGKRNLRRMLDYALTDFFTQNPILTCCLITNHGPLFVHETLFGAQCANWMTIRWSGRKRVASSGNALIIDLRPENISIVGLWTVIQYIYTGIFTITADNVFESQRAADYLGVPVITDACLRMLNCLTSPKMVCYTIESLRRQHKESHPLWTLALGRLVVCFDECRNDKLMVCWPLDVILPILEQPELYTKDEVNVYNLAVRWVEADYPRRRVLVPQIMNTIRFASMTGDVLLAISSHARILDGHPNLRQEIADLHLKIRMEDSGFEIPPEMDWSIPRRSRRTINAARAYNQSGRDLNVLMLYFCPRVSDFSAAKEAADSTEIFTKYRSISSKFLLITEDGRFSGQWIYCGWPKYEMREAVLRRKNLLRARDSCDQSCLDLDSRPTAAVKRQKNHFSDDENDLFESAPKPLHEVTPETTFSDIFDFLKPEYYAPIEELYSITKSETKNGDHPSRTTTTMPSLSVSKISVPELLEKVTGHLQELRKSTGTTDSMPELRKRVSTSSSPVRKTVSDGSRLHSRMPPPVDPFREKRTPSAERRAVIQSESLMSVTLRSENGSQESLHAEIHHEKKWYVELAEKMNVFVKGDPVTRGQYSAAVSSLSLQSEDL